MKVPLRASRLLGPILSVCATSELNARVAALEATLTKETSNLDVVRADAAQLALQVDTITRGGPR